MMKKSAKIKIIFFGNERLATAIKTKVPVLKALIKNGYDIRAVVINQSPKVTRPKRTLEIEEVTKQHKIEVIFSSVDLSKLQNKLKSLKPDIGILVAYGKIVPKSIIDLFPLGIINVHPSLLPVYRGPTPIEQTILDGKNITGVSLMRLVPKMDSGPVYDQAEIGLDGSESKQDLADKLSAIGAHLLVERLPAIINGVLEPKSQDESIATYTPKILKSDSLINWHKSAIQLEREVRAYAGWPGSHTKLGNKEVTITKGHAVPVNRPYHKPGEIEVVKETGMIMVECDSGNLCLERLKPAGKREMSAREFLSGIRFRLS